MAGDLQMIEWVSGMAEWSNLHSLPLRHLRITPRSDALWSKAMCWSNTAVRPDVLVQHCAICAPIAASEAQRWRRGKAMTLQTHLRPQPCQQSSL